jgi:hypothetical protein
MSELKENMGYQEMDTNTDPNIYIDPKDQKKYYMKLYRPKHPDQIPIPEIGKHKYDGLVWDPKLKSLIFKRKLMTWKKTKTNLKKNGIENKIQYVYNIITLVDINGKRTRVFQNEFERILEYKYLKKNNVSHDEDDNKIQLIEEKKEIEEEVERVLPLRIISESEKIKEKEKAVEKEKEEEVEKKKKTKELIMKSFLKGII